MNAVTVRATGPATGRPTAAWRGVLRRVAITVGLLTVVAAVALPFAPVVLTETTVAWPAPGGAASSTTAFFAPSRPAELTATVPCAVVRAGVARGAPTALLATGADGTGLAVRTVAGQVAVELGGRVAQSLPVEVGGDCGLRVLAGAAGVTVEQAGQRRELPGEPVPEVTAFRTALDPSTAAGLAVTARTAATPWQSSPTSVKAVLLVMVLVLVGVSLGLLRRIGVDVRGGSAAPRPVAPLPVGARRWRWLVDAGVLGTLVGWAVIGPLTDDDGFATTIARAVLDTGDAGNYYRWFNASEAPFALSQQLLAPLTELSLAPLWLRLPGTLVGCATWFVLSRGVLGTALPGIAGTARVRVLAAAFFLAAWLPFNLGTRPEPYVALGVTAVLALLLRARSVAGLGAAVLVAGLTVPVSPTAVLVAAPALALAPRILRVLRAGARDRCDVLARLALLAGVGSVAVVLVFADQSWAGLAAATELHTAFDPSVPWHHEAERYAFLLGFDSQGSAARRLPVLLGLALLPAVGVLLARRGRGILRGDATHLLAGSAAWGFALLWLLPSKWTHHFGALAGLLAALLVGGVVLLARAAGTRRDDWLGLAAGAVAAIAAAVAFAAANVWFLPVNYPVPWADGPIRPFGLPLDSPVLWAGVALVTGGLGALRGRGRRALVAAPAVVTTAAAGTLVVLLVVSFVGAAGQRPGGYTLAGANLDTLTGGPSCGIADHVEALPDVPDGALVPVPGSEAQLAGFEPGTGFPATVAPPDPPGQGASTYLWGSRAPDAVGTGELTSPWFALPALGPGRELAVSAAGRVGGGTGLTLEFARGGEVLGVVTPQAPAQNSSGADARGRVGVAVPDLGWRGMAVQPQQVPPGADQVRLRAVDAATDPDGWLAVTGPRIREVISLTDYLQSSSAGRGPVLIDFQMAFLLPCQREIPRVAGGLAQAPVAVIEPSRRYPPGELPTSTIAGGNFVALNTEAQRRELPTRLRGSPDVEWGHLVLLDYPLARDAYAVEQRQSTVPGWAGS